ncbi:MAG: methyltransferase domain-containing protein [Candidatus Aenigmarchaeota archaeon]|nr:methyltransferase domain-containing protein [Candidatus Aenigmarchaeota archaeon]
MKEDLKTTSLPWRQIAYMWKTYFTVPSRISPQEIEKYREWLKEINKDKKPLKGLVLGATPELRDALFDFEYLVHSIDINLDMFLAMEELLKNKNPKEVLIKANWLNNPLANSYFDVVVGDAILPNIPWKERSHLLSEVKRVLKPNGIFLTRTFCAPDKKPFSSVEEILEYFSKKEPNMQSALEMVLELHILTHEPKNHIGSFAKAKEVLEEYHKREGMEFENKNLQKIHDVVWNFWCKKFVNKVFLYAFRNEEENDYKKYFKIIEFFEAKDHDYSKITPMYFLRVL